MPDQEDGSTGSDTDTESTPANKVARLIDTYGLGEGFGDRLEALWTAEGEERESLRTLAARFNRRLLEVEMTEAGMSTLDGEVYNLYRLLSDDEVSSGVRTEARVRLEREGVNVERLEQDFVTYQAIRSYLKEYRGADYQRGTDSNRIETAIETIQRLQSRVRSVAERNLQQLRDTGRLSLGEFRLFVGIEVLCEDCNEQYGLIELLKREGCQCEQATNE
ncbi:MAG: hypothetical protein V5A27_09015 [Halapricum sp.]